MVQLGQLKTKTYGPLKQIHFGYVKLQSFHGNIFLNLKNGSVPTKIHITYISATAYPIAPNLVSN